MDFLLTKEQRDFRLKVRQWFAENLPENWRQRGFIEAMPEERRGRELREWERKVHGAGLTGLHWPVQYGGQGKTLVEHFIYGEEAGRAGAPVGINPIGRELLAGVMLHAGTEEQKRYYLPRIASAEHVWCQGFSEPNAGSDLTSLKTTATLQDGQWCINGSKIWTSYAQHADFCFVLARTSREPKKHQGLSMLIVPMSADGLTRRSIRQLDGTPDFNQLTFDNVRVPEENVIGPVGQGWQASNAVLAIERATTRLYRQSLYLRELTDALSLNHARGGARSARNSDYMRQKFSSSYARLLALRAVNISFVSRIVAGETVGHDASISKQCWSHYHQHSTATISELLGDEMWVPLQDEDHAEHFVSEYLHSKAETIFAGTSEIQKTIIAERVLGLPRG